LTVWAFRHDEDKCHRLLSASKYAKVNKMRKLLDGPDPPHPDDAKDSDDWVSGRTSPQAW
jgi:hypothetical protein